MRDGKAKRGAEGYSHRQSGKAAGHCQSDKGWERNALDCKGIVGGCQNLLLRSINGYRKIALLYEEK